MHLSVIIPTCNRNDLLEKCLDCIAPGKQTLDATLYEVIVSDDSKDNIARELIAKRFPWVKWVEGPKRGPAANRNNGGKRASYGWLVFVDDDCLPDEGWLKGYSDAIAVARAKVLEGLTTADKVRTRFDEESPINLMGGYLWSCNFAIEKELFFSIGGFDELFPYPAMEDTDLHVRILKVAVVHFIPAAKVIHPWRKVKPFKGYKKWVASHTYFAKKHGTYGTFSYRFSRMKIFGGDIFRLLRELAHFSFKGGAFYFERLLFDFIMIFA